MKIGFASPLTTGTATSAADDFFLGLLQVIPMAVLSLMGMLEAEIYRDKDLKRCAVSCFCGKGKE